MMTPRFRRLVCKRDNITHVFFAVVEGSLNPDGPDYRPWDSNNPRHLKYCVFTTESSEKGEYWFEAKFTEINESVIQCTMLDAYQKPQYLGKGIPEGIFQDLSGWLGKTIISSSNIRNQRPWTEYRTDSAKGVWKRLEGAGHAKYDAQTDRFTYVP